VCCFTQAAAQEHPTPGMYLPPITPPGSHRLHSALRRPRPSRRCSLPSSSQPKITNLHRLAFYPTQRRAHQWDRFLFIGAVDNWATATRACLLLFLTQQKKGSRDGIELACLYALQHDILGHIGKTVMPGLVGSKGGRYQGAQGHLLKAKLFELLQKFTLLSACINNVTALQFII